MDTSFARSWLRWEGVVVLLVAGLLYRHFDLHWTWFGLGFLAPDLAMLGYLVGPRAGALAYNLAHTYTTAGIVLGVGLACGVTEPCGVVLIGVGLVWCAHIGFDRALGYGLKSPEGFRFTHLGRIGRDRHT
jgi:hypothetical protein